MPPSGKEVQLTQVEVDLMAVFIKYKLLQDKQCTEVLRQLVDKLEGTYERSH